MAMLNNQRVIRLSQTQNQIFAALFTALAAYFSIHLWLRCDRVESLQIAASPQQKQGWIKNDPT